MPPQGTAGSLDGSKKMVRAVLLSAKNGLTLREFLSDYKEIIGQHFPYRNLGFPTPESCLQEMKDVVWVDYTRSGEIKLRGVADETTQHIADLVSKQKSKKSGGRSRMMPLRLKQVVRAKQQMERQQQPPIVPNFIRTNIMRLLGENPEGILGSSFNAIYGRRFGTQIDYNRLRFNNVKELLMSIRDIVRLENMASGGCRVFLADGNRETTAQKPSTDYQHRGKYLPPALRGGQSTGEAPPDVNRRNQDDSRAANNRYTNFGATWRESSREDTQQNIPKPDSGANQPSPRHRSSHGHRREREKPDYADGIPADVKKKLKATLKRRKAGMFCSRLQKEYKEVHNEELAFKTYGFTSIIEFVSALPDIAAIERPNPKGDWVLYDAETHKQTNTEQPTNTQQQKQKAESKASAHIEFEKRLVQLLNKHPNGLLLAMLPDVYKQTYGESLDPRCYNYVSIDAMVRHFADRLLKLSYQGNGRDILYPIACPVVVHEVPKPSPVNPVNPSPVRPTTHHHRHIQSDVVLSGSTFIRQRVPHNVEYVEVFVSNVNHPGKIWIQLKGTSTTDSLEELMDCLEEIYCGNQSELYPMPEDYISVGMPCAVVFPEDQNWHRCTISSAPEDKEFVYVYFVDYGNTCSVHRSAVYFLKSKFMKLPAQAIEARLANITMANDKYWTEASKNFLLRLVANKPLIAYVTDVQYDCLSVCLCDTNGETDIHINDLLIEECHAKFKPDNITDEAYNQLEEDLTQEKGFDYVGAEGATPPVEGLTEEMEALEIETSQRYVKFVRLNLMYDVHLVNYNGTAYLPGTEISAWFWEANKLRAMLRTKRLNIPNKVVCQEDDPELFEEFKHFQVKGLMEGGEVKPYTTIYELSSVPLILETLKHPSSELKSSINDLIAKFDPEDSYWKGEECEVTDESETDGAAVDVSLDDLNLMLKAMQFRRHRLLQNMASAFSETTVDEVNEVEIQINAIQEKIKSISGGKEAKKMKASTETPHIVRADSDEYIQNCLDNLGGGDATSTSKETKPEESKPAFVNRVAPFVDTSKTVTMTSPSMATSESQTTQAGAVPSTATSGSTGVGLPLPGQVGMGMPGFNLPVSTNATTGFNLPGVSQAGVGMLPMMPNPINQSLLSAEQQQQILAMASMIQGTMLPQSNILPLSTSRGAAPAPFMFQPMMNMPGMPNLMMPMMPPLGRGQATNVMPNNHPNPGAKPPFGK